MATNHDLTQTLMDAIGFTPEELALNREGRLSKRQRKSLRQYDFGRATKASELLDIIFVKRPLWTMIALLRRFLGKEVRMIEGVVKISTERRDNTLTLGDCTFHISRAVLHSFEDGARYRIYYDAHPKTLVSYEVKRLPELLSAETS